MSEAARKSTMVNFKDQNRSDVRTEPSLGFDD